MPGQIYVNETFSEGNSQENDTQHHYEELEARDNGTTKSLNDITLDIRNSDVIEKTKITSVKIAWKKIILLCVMTSIALCVVTSLGTAFVLKEVINHDIVEKNQKVSLDVKNQAKAITKQAEDITNTDGKIHLMQMQLKETERKLGETERKLNETERKLKDNERWFDALYMSNTSKPLYYFASHTFTTCSNTGPDGPSLSSCRNHYSSAAWAKNNDYFTMNVTGIQRWTVPVTGIYDIEAYGARGGSGNNGEFRGGRGAGIQGTFVLKKASVINILCGQIGSDGGTSESGGGGGGTFIYTGPIGGSGLLIAAGGGGGGGEEDTAAGYDGQGNQTSYNYYGYNDADLEGNGGIGYGGLFGEYTTAGAGWKSSGIQQTSDNAGRRWKGGSGSGNTGAGGFGGGGSGSKSSGGGGAGGYTGGSGISNSTRTAWGGSGAGSYNGGINQINTSGRRYGDGYVSVTREQSLPVGMDMFL